MAKESSCAKPTGMALGEASPQNGSTHPDTNLPEKEVLMIARVGDKALTFRLPHITKGTSWASNSQTNSENGSCCVSIPGILPSSERQIKAFQYIQGKEATPAGWELGQLILAPGPGLVGRVWEVWQPSQER